MSSSKNDPVSAWAAWDRFWFAPRSTDRMAMIRGLLCLVAAAYFATCWADAAFWYGGGGPFSAERVATFLRTAGLEGAAAWIVSPLFLFKSAWLYHLYLAVSIGVAGLVACGRGGRLAPWALWLLLVGWANRAMILAGLTESLLSLGLFASAIAPPGSLWAIRSKPPRSTSQWTAGFSQRLLATQVSVVLIATAATMLAGRVWFNGLGAYALAAPSPDRTIDWTNTILLHPLVHESLTHLMIVSLPIGLLMCWIERTNRLGKTILLLWCLIVALLGSLWLYAATMAVMVMAIDPIQKMNQQVDRASAK